MTVVDDCTRECLALIGGTSLSGARVARELSTLFDASGKPQTVVIERRRSENDPGIVFLGRGSEFTSNAILKFVGDRKFDWHYIALGKSTQNALAGSPRPSGGNWENPGPVPHLDRSGVARNPLRIACL